MTIKKTLAAIGTAAIVLGMFAGAASAKPTKVDVCHATGNGSYRLINVSENAVPAHQAHGDVLAGTGDLDEDCNAVVTTRVNSGPMEFGPNGWGGWSCPVGTTAVSGGFEPTTADVAVSQIAAPGQNTYPVYPHYTFSAGETGWVVQNDNDNETIEVFVDCAAN